MLRTCMPLQWLPSPAFWRHAAVHTPSAHAPATAARCCGCSNAYGSSDFTPYHRHHPQAALGLKSGLVTSGDSLDYTNKCMEIMEQVPFGGVRGWIY